MAPRDEELVKFRFCEVLFFLYISRNVWSPRQRRIRRKHLLLEAWRQGTRGRRSEWVPQTAPSRPLQWKLC